MALSSSPVAVPSVQDCLVFTAHYTSHTNLAHAPQGQPCAHGLRTYRLDGRTGNLTLLSITEGIENPAFLRYHPQRNILYACTETIEAPGRVEAFSVSPTTGQLRKLCSESAEGTSTCYLTLDRECRHLLFVNYWDSTVGTLPLTPTGRLKPVSSILRPVQPMKARQRGDHLSNRQSEPHAHAIVLDPVLEQIAYVPDLGMDAVDQLVFDKANGTLRRVNSFPAGDPALGPHGPRYIIFHPELNVAFLVNELSSTVSVFEFSESEADNLATTGEGRSLHLLQSVSTIPLGFPRKYNTCGRIAVDPSGHFVVVSNRGHDSLAVFRVEADKGGQLAAVGFVSTRGRTPRHFQFSSDGRFLLVGNQDTGTLAVFQFDVETGMLTFRDTVDCPSVNFVCCQSPHVASLVSRL